MFWRVFVFLVTLFMGFVVGYFVRPQTKVEIYDPAVCVPGSDEFQRFLYSNAGKRAAALSPEMAANIARAKRMKPLVKAGPFHLSLNSTTGDFLILQTVDQQPIVEQTTSGEETTLSFTGKGLRPTVNITYNRKTGKLLRSNFTSFGKGGLYGPVKYTYNDTNGNGRFDEFNDHTTGNAYVERDLTWVKVGSTYIPTEYLPDPERNAEGASIIPPPGRAVKPVQTGGTGKKVESTIVAGRGWGPVHIGATSSEIKAALGDGENLKKYRDVYFLDYPRIGIQLSFSNKHDTVQAIFFYNKQKGREHFATFKGKTSTGIDWTSSEENVIETYGKPIRDYTRNDADGPQRRLVFKGIDFRFENGKMVRIGVPAS